LPRVIVVVLCLCLAACVSSKKPEVLNPVAASAPGARAIDVHVATTRVPEPNGYFSDRRGQHLSFQYVKISIPPDHTPGQIEWHTGEFGDPGKNFVTLDNRVLAEQQFLRNLEARLPASGEVMVFVHGYNTNHEEAIFRLAQMAADGDTKIAAIAFTWPSRGVVKDYVTDRESSTAARGHLIDFLTMLSRSPKIKAINLFAHSMGAMLTTDALMLAKLRGNGEFGGKAALPIWIGYMKEALLGQPELVESIPNGIVSALIDPTTGLPSKDSTSQRISEYFRTEDLSRIEQLRSSAPEKSTNRETFDIF